MTSLLEMAMPIPMACFAAHHRLSESYSRFDRSLRQAEARLPQSVLTGWLRPLCDQESEETCAVCFMPLGNGAAPDSLTVTPPCAHSFHFDCLRHWLRLR